MKTLYLGIGVGICILSLLVGIYMRERSWSKHSLALKAQLNDATFNFESALLFLQIDILTRAPQTVIGIKQTDLCKHENGIMCPTSSIPEQEKNATSFLLANSQEKLRKFFVESEYLIDEIPKILTARYYFDRSGLMLLGIFLSLKLLEIKYGHGDVYDPIKCVVDADSNREFHGFVKRWTPITTMCLFWCLLVGGTVAWFNLLLRTHTFAVFGLKCVLMFMWSMPLSVAVVNIATMIKYLPKTKETWIQSIKLFSWWRWVFGCVCGIDSAETGVVLAFQVLGMVLLIWPYRYLYFYKEGFVGSQDAANVFVVNMIIQASYTICLLSSMAIKVFGSPQFLRIPQLTASTAKPQQNLHKYLKYINPFLMDSANSQLFVLILMANSLLAVIRVIWFICVGGVGYWGTCVLLCVCLTHILLPLTNLALISTHVTRTRLIPLERERFVHQFASAIATAVEGEQKLAGAHTQSAEQKLKDEQYYTDLAESIFDALVDRTMRSYTLGVGPITYTSFDERSKKEQQDKEKSSSAGADTQPSNIDPDDKSLKDLKLALDYTTVEFHMSFAQFGETLQSVGKSWVRARVRNNAQQGSGSNPSHPTFEDVVVDDAYLQTLNATERTELIKETLSALIGAHLY